MMMNECVPESRRTPWPIEGRSGFRVVLGQPDEQKGGRGAAMSQDEKLRERVAEDLDASFEELVRTYQDRLFSYALRLTARREDAEEVAQDAFVRAYRALATYPAERIRALALKPWLYRITLNLARNRFRGKKLKTVSLDHPLSPGSDAAWEAADTPEAQPDRQYERSRERQDIAALMAGLPERYRAPLQLRYVEGLRLEEVATVLRQPLGTTKSNVHRGINALREALSRSRREGVRS
jgi:RNA polymerase sigma-70 factor (ECF subfamily)